MAEEYVDVRIRLRDARKFMQDSNQSAAAVRRLGGAADRSGRSVRGANRSWAVGSKLLRSLGTSAKYGIAGLAGLSVVLGRKAITEYREAARAGRETNAVIKSTGGVANVTANDVSGLSEKLSLKAGIDDEAIQSGANMLLTFKRIRNESGKGNDIFNQTSEIMVDLAAKFGTSMPRAAVQLGKALNDPTKGLTALTRVGVTFDDQQKEQIKKLQASGDLMGAQRIILRELNSEFRGTAAAQADPISRLNVAWNNLLETVGGKLAPHINLAATRLAKFVTEMERGTGEGGRFVVKAREIWKQVKITAAELWKAVKPYAQMALAAGKFFAYNDDARTAALRMLALAAAVKTISFASQITGMSKLMTLARSGGGTPWGAIIAGLVGVGIAMDAVIPSDRLDDRFKRIGNHLANTTTSRMFQASMAGNARAFSNLSAEAQRNIGHLGKAGGALRRAAVSAQRLHFSMSMLRQTPRTLEQLRSRATQVFSDIRNSVATTAQKQQMYSGAIRTAISSVNRMRQQGLITLRQETAEIKRLLEEQAAAYGVSAEAHARNQQQANPGYRGNMRRGGVVGMASGGLAGVKLSPGELLRFPGGGESIVPGRWTGRDSWSGVVPRGTEVYTWHGQMLRAMGLSAGKALERQQPHFATGGIIDVPTLGVESRLPLPDVAMAVPEQRASGGMVGERRRKPSIPEGIKAAVSADGRRPIHHTTILKLDGREIARNTSRHLEDDIVRK